MKHRNKRKNSKGERDDSPSNGRNPEISFGTSNDDELSELQLFADPCCHELIQKCTGRHFACACQKQFYRCKCGWKLLGLKKGVYKCDTCDATVANCVGCGSFQVKKKGNFFNVKAANTSSRKSYTILQISEISLLCTVAECALNINLCFRLCSYCFFRHNAHLCENCHSKLSRYS